MPKKEMLRTEEKKGRWKEAFLKMINKETEILEGAELKSEEALEPLSEFAQEWMEIFQEKLAEKAYEEKEYYGKIWHRLKAGSNKRLANKIVNQMLNGKYSGKSENPELKRIHHLLTLMPMERMENIEEIEEKVDRLLSIMTLKGIEKEEPLLSWMTELEVELTAIRKRETQLKEEALLKAKQETERAARLELELAKYKRQSAAQGEKIDNVEEQASAAEEPEAKRQKQENLSEGSVSNLKFM